MPRLVRLSATGPTKIEPQDKPISICACGLSQRFPICDGSHKACKDREPDPTKLYVYNDARTEIIEVRDLPPQSTPAVGSV